MNSGDINLQQDAGKRNGTARFLCPAFQLGLSPFAAPKDAAAIEEEKEKEEEADRAVAGPGAEQGKMLRVNVLLSILGSNQCKIERLVLTELQSSYIDQPCARSDSAAVGRRL